MRPFSFKHKFGRQILSLIQKYDHKKYWRRRNIVINPTNKTNILIKLYYLYYIKKTDAYHKCSFGTNLNSGSIFKTPPTLPHGPMGIIIGHDLEIGMNVTIFHQVTLAHGKSIIGDNVLFGAGSKLMSGFNVGSFSKIGANAVVVEDIPEYSTVVIQKPKIILNEK